MADISKTFLELPKQIKKVKVLKKHLDQFKTQISLPSFKSKLFNGSNVELFEITLSIINDTPFKETNLLKELIDLIETCAACGYIPRSLFTKSLKTVTSSYRITTHPINKAYAQCISTFIISQTNHIHSENLVEAFKIVFDSVLLLNIHDCSVSNDINILTQLIEIIILKMEMANSFFEQESDDQQPTRLSELSPVANDAVPCFTDSLDILHFLNTLITTRWSQHNIENSNFKSFLSTITSEAKDKIDLKSKLHALRLMSIWLNRFSFSIRDSETMSHLLQENATTFLSDIQESLIHSTSSENLFEESIPLLQSVIKHRAIFKTLLNEIFHGIIFPLLRHPNVLVKKKLEFFNLVKSSIDDEILGELFINSDCELYGEYLTTELFQVVLWCIEQQDEPTLRHASINSLQHLVGMVRKLSETKDFGDLDINALVSTKNRFNEIKQLFKEHPKKGIDAFIKEGYCGESVEEIVQFMIETSDLDKVAIGQYVGMVNEFNQSVLKALIEHLDFHGIDVDVGLRMVFDTFVMGGESQVVDRVMVTFGNHFFNCNKVELEELQLNPDNVYQIATSIIFLSTESHNPSAKTKAMETFEKFKDVIVNGFGISLNDEMLKGIFERTTKKAFHLPRSSIVDEINELDFVELQAKKRIQMVDSDLRKLRDLTQIRIQPKLFTPYITNTSSMLPVLLYQVFALQTVECIERVYDKLLEEDEVKIILQTLIDTIHLACTFHHSLKRRVINSLIKITKMDTNDLSSISSRNVVAVLSLIDLCLVECENIQECWEDCLYTIVKMERLHMIASGWKEEQPHIQNNASRRSRFGVLPQYPKGVSTTILTANMIPQCVLETSSLEFGKLYVSLRFSDTSVVEFFRGLCAVAQKEIEAPIPRLFVLQRIVVTAESNTDKSEKVWKQIWEYLTPFYIRCGLHPNEDVSMSVLNNLRQLTTNSLKHEEKETNNQSLFLQPYVIIISDHPSLTVRQFVIQAMNQIVSNQKGCQNLKSGWSTLFEVFLFSSVDEQVSISAFQVFKQLFKIYRTSSFFEHYYFHFLRCIHSFGKTTSPEEVGIQLNSLIQHILTSTFSSNDLLEVNHEVYTKIIPLFQILSNGVLSPHMSVCTNAISVLFNVLEIFRKTVTNDMMETLLSCCVLPLFTTNTTLTWINNVSELLFQSILQFLIEEKQFQKYLIQVLKFSFYVVFHQGSSFSTHALSFINCLISKATEHENTNLLHEIVEQFCVYFDTILHYIPVLDKYTNSQRENQISSETDPKLTDVCLVCNKEVISEYLIPCPVCGKQKYCSSKCYINNTENHMKICLTPKEIEHLEIEHEDFLENTPKSTSNLIEKMTGINNVCQTLLSLFSILIKWLTDDDLVIIFQKITDIFNKFFNLFDKHQTFVSTFSKSENLIEIYDLFVVQLFEMYLHLFLLDEKHRNLVISLFYSFIESVLIKFVENKYIYTLSVPKSVVLSFISQITKIQNDEAVCCILKSINFVVL